MDFTRREDQEGWSALARLLRIARRDIASVWEGKRLLCSASINISHGQTIRKIKKNFLPFVQNLKSRTLWY